MIIFLLPLAVAMVGIGLLVCISLAVERVSRWLLVRRANALLRKGDLR